MLEAIRKRLEKDEEGFTLIELMVVVLIIGILVAIAVPTFLNAQNNAKSKAAQSNARSALSAAKTVQAEQETYYLGSDAATLAALQAGEPSLDWTSSPNAVSASPDDISWNVTTNGFQITMAVRSKNGECFLVRDNINPDTTVSGRGTWFAKTTGTTAAAGCTANATANYRQSQTDGWPKSGASVAESAS
ncbi:MAG TPA: type II secretion system protein [Acidimicrobiales bacterium]|nr:type II secretion system protein [Acidimicrobiales bacterium]